MSDNNEKAQKKGCGCTCRKEKEEKREALRDYPGAAIDQADDDKVSRPLEKERTKILGDNPRNNDL